MLTVKSFELPQVKALDNGLKSHRVVPCDIFIDLQQKNNLSLLLSDFVCNF